MNLPNLFINYFITTFVLMIHLHGKEAEEHISKFKIKELPFEMVVHTIIKIKDTYLEEIRSAYMNAEFITKDVDSGNYYLAMWGSGGGHYSEMYSFIKIYFDLYHSYINGDISYHRFRFESLKRSNVIYKMSLYNRQFCKGGLFMGDDTPEIVLKPGNVIEYSHGYAIDFGNMCSYYMTIPYEYKEEYEPLGFSCEEIPWDENNMYKKGQTRKHDNNPGLKVFVKMMRRVMKISEVLD